MSKFANWLMLYVALSFTSLSVSAQTSAEAQSYTLRFSPVVGEALARCGERYADLGTDQAHASFNDFRMYVSNIQFISADGTPVPFRLEQDGMWQFEDVALLDFEDGTAGCSEIGNAALNGEVRGTLALGDYVGVRFDVGVPFALNHVDVTAAASPLNLAALWWNWQGGYKFLRVDLMTDHPDVPAWNVHLGSTGCQSAAGAVPPREACARPNIASIHLMDFDPETSVIVADLAGLLAQVSLSENTLMPPGCMSGVDDPDCPALFAGLGLSLAEGVCPDERCAEQTFFRLGDSANSPLIERSVMAGDMNKPDGGHNHGG